MTEKSTSRSREVNGFEDLFDRLLEESEGDEISVSEMLDAFGHRAFGPLILVPALLAVLPTGAIPGVPIVLGLVIILVSGQMLLGKTNPWIPRRLRERSVKREVVEESWERFRPVFKRIDSLLKTRLTFLAKAPFIYPVAVIVIALAIAMAPLEIVPFAVAVPGLAICAFGIGITARDGLVVLGGFALCAATVWLISATLL